MSFGHQEPPVIIGPVQAIILLLIIFAVPVFALSPVLEVNVGRLPPMLFESLGLGFLWNRSTSGTIDDEVYSYDRRRTKRKKLVRSRADLAPSVSSGMCHWQSPWWLANERKASPKTAGYYPGLVNISGTYCFLNATLQVSLAAVVRRPYANEAYRPWHRFRTYNRI